MSPAPIKPGPRPSRDSLAQALEQLRARHHEYIAQGLSLDLTRGKPSTAQLDLSNALLEGTTPACDKAGTDLRNYGVLDGLPKAKQLFGALLGVDPATASERVFVGGNSSLSLMHYTLWFAQQLGLGKQSAWREAGGAAGGPLKFLCPTPGYDRHFSICAQLGIEMVNVPLTGAGPDMDMVEAHVKADPSIVGIWCVPRFSNPTGEVYSEATVERLAKLPGLSNNNNFYVLWDNAYALHAFSEQAQPLASIERHASSAGTLDHIIQFGSTSKITFAGAGVGYMASSAETIAGFRKHFAMASIGADKLNQHRHIEFLRDLEHTERHMARHAQIIAPKFAAVATSLREHLADADMGEWSDPQGGYFVSFNTRPGLAKKVVALAAEAGVKLTPAGATFPNQFDPDDKNIRLAPSFPELAEVNQAMQVFVNCVQLASTEQALQQF